MLIPRRKMVIILPFKDNDFYNPETQLIRKPEMAKERSDQGIIKLLGRDCDPDLKIGDHVIFSGYTGTTIGIDNELMIEVHSDFIKGRIEDDEDKIVPGVYFKSNYKSEILEDEILSCICDLSDDPSLKEKEEAAENIMHSIAKYLNNLYFPAPYIPVTDALALAHSSIAQRVEIKSNIADKESRDPVDERNR